MSDQPFDVSVLPPFQPGMVLVLRGVDFGDDDDADRAILRHYHAVAEREGHGGKDAAGILPVIIHLADPASSIDVLDEEQMAANGWVRRP